MNKLFNYKLWLVALGVCGLSACAQSNLAPSSGTTTLPVANAPSAGQPVSMVRWFPIYLRFSPTANWAVVNLCSNANPLYCKLVRWEPDGASSPLDGGGQTTGKWSLIAGQEANKSYIWPSVSWGGTKLGYVVADCKLKGQPNTPNTTGSAGKPLPPEALDCAFYNGQPAVSESVTDLRVGQKIAPIYSAAKPAWRPDDKALLYWRTIANVTLASGRMLGHRDIYEYDFATDTETPKFNRAGTRVLWSSDATGPFYAADGKSFTMCGFAFSLPVHIDQNTPIHCTTTDTTNPNSGSIKGIPTKNAPTPFVAILADLNTKDGAWLTRGASLDILSKTNPNERQTLLITRQPTKPTNFSPSSAARSIKSELAVISGTLFGFSEPIRALTYWTQLIKEASPTPVMFSLKSTEPPDQTVAPVYWPNLESLR